ncbi:hypothetical protein F8M41_001531 [Gigaspora margarita]|uniref:F-box domain-containing protein n=1 Tax=Gigaspora margarita TaxID=4874 RepID=A0A8H4A8Z8_GIGMA|nr:hypothetical protein F8M41_001531 [Gigaspora margarita]
MASKMLMGDMPELMENILNHLNKEFNSLYSCALVSRHWCKISIPILWQDPFTFYHHKPLIISQYLSSLGKDEKIGLQFMLKACKINTQFPKTIFDYASFLKVLDLYFLKCKVENWLSLQRCPKAPYNLLTFTIIKLLIKKFIESGATLQELNLDFSVLDEIQPEICYSLEQNMQFLSRLQDLSINSISSKSKFNIESLATLLKILGKATTKLNTLNIEVPHYYDPQLFHSLICIINSQKQLKQFYMSDTYGFSENLHNIISALKSQKQSLQECRIFGCKFTEVFKVLANFENLETLCVGGCKSSNNKELLKILEKNFYKINTFEVITNMGFDTLNIVQCLKKFGSLLQRLKLEAIGDDIVEQSLLLETIKSFCPNITYLYIWDIGLSAQFQELIGNLQKLQFLTLYDLDDELDEIIEEDLRRQVIQFAGRLPSTLQYLDINSSSLNSYIDILLNHCNAPLKKLIISHLDEKNAKALIEFSIRKRTLNYVGVHNVNENFKKEMEGYVTLVPYENAVISVTNKLE